MTAAALLATAGGVLAEGGSDGGGDFTPTSVTPGVTGFLVVFAIAAVTVLLIVDMVRRVRRLQARARVEERHRAEAADEHRDAGADGAPRRDDETDGDDASGTDAPPRG